MVDKYSGYEICKIEYSDEGYEESGAKKIVEDY